MAQARALMTSRGSALSTISLRHSLPERQVRNAARERSEAQIFATILQSPSRKLFLAARKRSSYLAGKPASTAGVVAHSPAHQQRVVPLVRAPAKFAACSSQSLGSSSM